MAHKKHSSGVSRLDAALGQIPAKSNHVIWGKLEVKDSSSASLSSALRGVRMEENSGSSQDPSGSLRSPSLRSASVRSGSLRSASLRSGSNRPKRTKGSQPHGCSGPTTPLRPPSMSEAQTSVRMAVAVSDRPLQANGDVAVDMDSDACDSEIEEWPVAIKPSAREQAQQSVAACYNRELHDAGKCRPCSYFVKKGCKGGEACTFCHLEHEVKARPCKQKREKCKMQILHPVHGDATAERMKAMAERETLQGRYMRDLMEKCEMR